jgi:hypothetical protein
LTLVLKASELLYVLLRRRSTSHKCVARNTNVRRYFAKDRALRLVAAQL